MYTDAVPEQSLSYILLGSEYAALRQDCSAQLHAVAAVLTYAAADLPPRIGLPFGRFVAEEVTQPLSYAHCGGL